MRRNRNVRNGAKLDQLVAGNKRLDNQIRQLEVHKRQPPVALAFHAYETVLMCAMGRGHVALYDWEEGECLNDFVNTTTRGNVGLVTQVGMGK